MRIRKHKDMKKVCEENDIRVGVNDLVKSIKYIDKALEAYADPRLATLGISNSRYTYMYFIAENPGITQDKLKNLDLLHPSNVSRGLEMLEKNGYITREVLESDRRTCKLYPTKKAEESAKAVNQIFEDWKIMLLEGVSAEEQQEFLRVLNKLVSNSESYLKTIK